MLNMLKESRKEKGWTQQEVANFLGISREKYNKVECGKAEPTLHEADMLAACFAVTIYELFPGMVSGTFYVDSLKRSVDEGVEIAKNAIYRTASAMI